MQSHKEDVMSRFRYWMSLVLTTGFIWLFFDYLFPSTVGLAVFFWRFVLRWFWTALRYLAVFVVTRTVVRRVIRLLMAALGFETVRIWMRFHGVAMKRLWQRLREWLRTVSLLIRFSVAVLCALTAGLVVGSFALVSMIVPGAGAVLTSIGSRTGFLVARIAAGRFIEGRFALVWLRLPARPRVWLERNYTHLWFQTMLRIVHNRRKVRRLYEDIRKRERKGRWAHV